jgi:transcription antitermination factor NusG
MGMDVSKLKSNEDSFKVTPRQARMGLGADTLNSIQKEDKYSIGDTVYVIQGLYKYKKGNIAKIHQDRVDLELLNGMEVKVKISHLVKQDRLKNRSRSRSKEKEEEKEEKGEKDKENNQ